MKKRAYNDITYCVNNNCTKKETCKRHANHYIFDEKNLYSFSNYDNENCKKELV